MSSAGYGTTLVFDIGRSRALTASVTLAYAVACGGIAVALPAVVAMPAVAAGVLALAVELRRLGRRRRLYWSGDGCWRLQDPEGPPHVLEPATWSTPWLVVLVLRGPGGVVRLPLARDTVSPQAWRRLRARLRVEGAASLRAAA